jgi:hypothetical protein
MNNMNYMYTNFRLSDSPSLLVSFTHIGHNTVVSLCSPPSGSLANAWQRRPLSLGAND